MKACSCLHTPGTQMEQLNNFFLPHTLIIDWKGVCGRLVKVANGLEYYMQVINLCTCMRL